MNKFSYKNLTPFKWFVLENFPFIEADFDALTEWQLFCKLGKEINKIIDSQNVVGTEMEKFSQAFIELQNYVNNYFENLDVQDEINNKLNEMAESGKLQEIIGEFLKLNSLLVFNTVNEMKNSTNLIANSKVRTLGFHKLNDKGGASYYIREVTNQDSVDEMFLIAINNSNLVAELIIDSSGLNVLQLGAVGDKSTDNYNVFNKAINYLLNQTGTNSFAYNNNNTLKTLLIPNGKYYISQQITINDINENGLNLIGESKWDTTLIFADNGLFFNKGMKRIIIKNISMNTKNKNSVLIRSENDIVTDSHIENCTFSGSYSLVSISQMAYAYFENCSFWVEDHDGAYGLKISQGEYTYITRCTFEGYGSKSKNYGIWIANKTIETYITQCDICNFNGGYGIFMDNTEADGRGLYITETSFVRNAYCIYSIVNFGFSDLYVTKCFFFTTIIEGYPQCFIYANRESGNGILDRYFIDDLSVYGEINADQIYFNVIMGTSRNHIYNLNAIAFVKYSSLFIGNVSVINIPKMIQYTLQTPASNVQTDFIIGNYKSYLKAEEYPTFKAVDKYNGYDFTTKSYKIFFDENGDLHLKFDENPGDLIYSQMYIYFI